MSQIFDIADRYVEKVAELSPFSATYMGVPGHDHEMNDFSPEAAEAEAERDRSTLAELESATVEDDKDRIARDAMVDSLSLSLDLHDANERFRSLSMIHSPVHSVRQIFDLMPRESEEHWANIASRMALIPQGLDSYRRTLDEGLRRGLVVAKRQARETAEQCDVWTGTTEGHESFFNSLVSAFNESGVASPGLRADLESGARVADQGIANMARFLRETYIPRAAERDAVGEDRYSLAARVYNGVELDLRETYEWGWEQLAWVESEMAAAADKITPGQGVGAAKELLETDPARAIEGEDEFAAWMQNLQDRTIRELDGTHFDIADPVKKIEALIAPPGGALAMYYTPPNEDFSRPGRTWYPTGGKDAIPALERGLNRVPRGRTGAPLSSRHDGLSVGATVEIPATAGRHIRPDRGLGAVRRAADGRARLSGKPRLLPGNAGGSVPEVDSSHHRHRNALGIGDTEKPGLPPRRTLDSRVGSGVHPAKEPVPARLRNERGEPLPRHSGPGHQLQSRREGVAGRTRGVQATPRLGLQSQGMAHTRTFAGPYGPRPNAPGVQARVSCIIYVSPNYVGSWCPQRSPMNRNQVLDLIRTHKATLVERFGVTNIALYGSFARDQATEESDVDVLIAFDGPATSKAYFGVQFYLEDLLGREVDLATDKALRAEIRPYIERDVINV